MSNEANKKLVMDEVAAALGRDDLLTVTRIFAHLSSYRIESMIYKKISEIYDSADETERVMATRFCEQHAKLRGLSDSDISA